MKRVHRLLTALFLTLIYLLITVSPLAPLAMRSPVIAHAVTGECSGDCNTCGCSAERRASHTCCCFLKKRHLQHNPESVPECCKNKKRHKMVMLTCNCPCDSNKQIGLWGTERSEQLPFHFTEGIFGICENTLFAILKSHLIDRNGDPPDPPPKLHFTE